MASFVFFIRSLKLKEELVGGKIFSDIQTDDRVTPDLRDCLYCIVETGYIGDRSINQINKKLDYKIPLDNTSKWMKQCPACKRIYILKDPRE